jgi:hypothetical protein
MLGHGSLGVLGLLLLQHFTWISGKYFAPILQKQHANNFISNAVVRLGACIIRTCPVKGWLQVLPKDSTSRSTSRHQLAVRLAHGETEPDHGYQFKTEHAGEQGTPILYYHGPQYLLLCRISYGTANGSRDPDAGEV